MPDRSNRYPANCRNCHRRVPARAGVLLEGPGRSWSVYCSACQADAPTATAIVSFRVVGERGPATVYRNARGTCEDAPCCGCCS